jgi:hypothetical protein
MVLWYAHESEDIGFSLVHERGNIRHFGMQLIGDLAIACSRPQSRPEQRRCQ